MYRSIPALALFLVLPSVASAFGGAGASLQHVEIGEPGDRWAGGDIDPPSSLDCVGLVGHGNVRLLRFGSGPLYKPSTKDFEPPLQAVCPSAKARLTNIWNYWEADDATEPS